MGDDGYIWQSDDHELATVRLEQLEAFLDPATYRLLDQLGVPRGGRCWELGAGRGTTALYLLARCGLGEVVATDVDMQWLDRIAHPCLRVLRHDILADDLEQLGTFDLIHTRMLIHHLGAERGPVALRRAVSLLNPGGAILVEEPIRVNHAARSHPDAATYEALVNAIDRFGASFGLDMDTGLQLPGLLRSAGLVGVSCELSGVVSHGGDAFRRWGRTTYELSKDTMGWNEVLGGRGDEFVRLTEDPELDFAMFVVASCSGRRPPG